MSYLDSSLPTDERLADLLPRMTLEEKAAQLGSVFASELLMGGLDEDTFARHMAVGVGEVTRLAGRTALPRPEVAAAANKIQRYLVEWTRLGIPAIVHEECLAGYMAVDATMFPQSLGLGASWRPDLARRIGELIASQMRLSGAHIGLSPVLDIGREPRWGRMEETYGEDPHLASALGLGMVLGLQHDSDGTGIIATMKHFVGHGVPEGGRNAATPHIPPREMTEVFMAPFEQAVRHGKVGAVMHAYHDLDGVPCIANRQLLTELLRDTWGFEGVVVSDYNGVEELHRAHRVAHDLQDAVVLSLSAGLDVELPETVGFGDPLLRAVRDGLLDEAVIDQAVERVLRQKFDLGLFEAPYVDIDGTGRVDADAAVVAAEVARASLVLLENDGLLPLSKDCKVALIGPNAGTARAFLGDYAHVVQQELLDEQRNSADSFDPTVSADFQLQTELVGVDSVHDAMVSAGLAVTYEQGCAVNDADRSGFDAAVALAWDSDVAVLVLGDRSGLTTECTSGESRDRTDLGLPGVQQELLEAVAATGTPVVLVNLSGRPNALPWAAENVDAIMWAVLPGQDAGAAIRDVVFGDAEPEGRLPVTVARDVGQLPIHYAHNPASFRSRWRDDYVEMTYEPLWCFGHGLGYTTFDVAVAEAEHAIDTSADEVVIPVILENTGERDGRTVVQVYAEQSAASVVRPAQRLVAFESVEVAAGESKELSLRVPVGRFSLVDQDFDRVVEPGTLDLAVGLSCRNIHGRVPVTLTGTSHPVPIPPSAL